MVHVVKKRARGNKDAYLLPEGYNEPFDRLATAMDKSIATLLTC